jgi:hypothetical protein
MNFLELRNFWTISPVGGFLVQTVQFIAGTSLPSDIVPVLADIKSKKPVTADNLSNLYSTSKVITCAAALQLFGSIITS